MGGALTVLYGTYRAPSWWFFSCFFDMVLSFVSNSTKKTAQPLLSHVQNGPYYVPYHFMAPFPIPFRSLTVLRKDEM